MLLTRARGCRCNCDAVRSHIMHSLLYPFRMLSRETDDFFSLSVLVRSMLTHLIHGLISLPA
jgi:hypothetical protein